MAVIVGVVLAGLLRVMDGMDLMALGHMGVVTGFVVVPSFMVFGGGQMVLGGVLVMLGSFLMVLSALFRHV
jgi:hypothetical protein